MIPGAIGRALTGLFDLLLVPFRPFPRIWGLLFLSILTGLWMILIFRAVSNQARIKALRKRMGGEVLGILLHVSRPGTVVTFAGRLIVSNAIYLWNILRPMLVIAIPFALTWGQLEARYGTITLHETRGPVTYTLQYGSLPNRDAIEVGGTGITVREPVMMVDTLREVSFRILPLTVGPKTLDVPGLSVPVGRTADWSGAIVSRGFRRGDPLERLFKPWLSSVRDRDGIPEAGDMSLPGTTYRVLGGNWSWLAVFLVFSSLAAIGGALVFRISI